MDVPRMRPDPSRVESPKQKQMGGRARLKSKTPRPDVKPVTMSWRYLLLAERQESMVHRHGKDQPGPDYGGQSGAQ